MPLNKETKPNQTIPYCHQRIDTEIEDLEIKEQVETIRSTA